jgi:hypothetical protein
MNRFPQGARTTAGKRALVVINEQVSGEELTHALVSHLGQGVEEVFVVAPAIPESGLDLIMGAVDEAIPPARERLEKTLQELEDAGISARGEVGDSDPIQAMSDEIVKFHPDQIIVVAHREGDRPAAEKGMLERAERDFELPVLELLVNREPDPEVLDVKSTKRGAGRDRGWRPSYNFPPLNKRDITGIAVAVVGTIVLGVLAAKGVANSRSNGNDHEENRLGVEVAAMLLIALAMALVNLAHVVGLFLFESVRYEGLFSRFFARLSLIGTPIAVAISVVLLVISGH